MTHEKGSETTYLMKRILSSQILKANLILPEFLFCFFHFFLFLFFFAIALLISELGELCHLVDFCNFISD